MVTFTNNKIIVHRLISLTVPLIVFTHLNCMISLINLENSDNNSRLAKKRRKKRCILWSDVMKRNSDSNSDV